jgi:hypothetical protein
MTAIYVMAEAMTHKHLLKFYAFAYGANRTE